MDAVGGQVEQAGDAAEARTGGAEECGRPAEGRRPGIVGPGGRGVALLSVYVADGERGLGRVAVPGNAQLPQHEANRKERGEAADEFQKLD